MNRFLLILTAPFNPSSYKEIFPQLHRKQVLSLLVLFTLVQTFVALVLFLATLPGTLTTYRNNTKEQLSNAVQSMDFTIITVEDNQLKTDLKNMPLVFTIKETDKQKTLFIIDTTANAAEKLPTYTEGKELTAVAFLSNTILIQTNKDTQEKHSYSEVFGNTAVTYTKQQLLTLISSNSDINLAKSFFFKPLSLLVMALFALIIGCIYFCYRYIGGLIISFIFAIAVFSFLPTGPQRRPLTLVKLNIFAYMGWTTTMTILKIFFLPFGGFATIYSFLNLFIIPEVFMWFVFKSVALRIPKEKKKP